ncbi:MFS transporter [Clostridium sp. Marseille-Q7071]
MKNNYSFQTSSKNFNLMVLGQIVSILGSALLRFGLSLYVLDITGRADIYATLYAISNIPLLLSPIGGAIADRFNRRNLMVIFDFTSSALVLCFFYLLISGNVTVLVIGMIMLLLALISSMYQPAVQASIPLLVQENKLEQANGIVSGVGALSNVTAPVLGGVLYGMLGLKMLIVISCIAFFLSAVMEIFIKIPFVKREPERHIIPTIAKDLKAGFVYVVKQPYILKAMVLAALLNLILTPFLVVGGPIILRVTMQSNETLYGIGMGIIQFSTILGALSIGVFAERMKMKTLYQWLLMIALLALPMAISLSPMVLKLGYYPAFIVFFICVVPIAMAMTILSIFVLTRVQKQTPNNLLGKVMAIITAVAQCAAPVGQILYGILFETFSLKVYLPTLFMSSAMLLTTVLAKVLYQREDDDA